MLTDVLENTVLHSQHVQTDKHATPLSIILALRGRKAHQPKICIDKDQNCEKHEQEGNTALEVNLNTG